VRCLESAHSFFEGSSLKGKVEKFGVPGAHFDTVFNLRSAGVHRVMSRNAH
jgi:hypothetical protein